MVDEYEWEYYDGDWGDKEALHNHNVSEALSEIAHYLKVIAKLLEKLLEKG